MLGLLAAHLRKQLRRGRIVLAKPLGEVGVDALVLFLERDRQRQNLALGEILEALHE